MLSTLWSVISRATVADWLLLGAGVLLGLYLLGTWTYDVFQRRGVPCSRPRLPFLGDSGVAILGIKTLPEIVHTIYHAGKGHSVYGFYQFRLPVLMLRDPEVIKAVTVKDFDHFMNHRPLVHEDADPIFAKSLFGSQGQYWREMRKTLSPAFTSSKIRGMFPIIIECSQQLANNLRDRVNSNLQDNQNQLLEVDMKDLFSRMANDVIATAAFGLRCDSLKERDNTFYRMGTLLTRFGPLRLLAFAGWFLVPGIMKILKVRALDPTAISFFSSLVTETISERQKKNIIRPDMLHLLMLAREGELKVDAQDEHEEEAIDAAKHKLTDEDIIAQAIFFFFAGFETVSTALSFLSLTISHHPEVQKRLQHEVDEVMKRTDRKLTYEIVQGMKYLDMVISETLRLYPALSATDRVCTEDTTLPAAGSTGPIRVRKGDAVGLPIIALHYDPEHWPDPEQFDPERFSEHNKHSIKPFTYMPFGVGPRNCVGQRFALLEVKLALINLLANFELHPSNKTTVPIQFETGLNMMVKGGFWCKVGPRSA